MHRLIHLKLTAVLLALGRFVLPALGATEADSGVTSLAGIPSFGLGTWLSERNKVSKAVSYSLNNGYSHIDAAMIYHNEDQVGNGISDSSIPRSNLWVTSKLWNDDHRPERVRSAIGKSISDLGVDYLDLYLIHWPVAFVPNSNDIDRSTSLTDTWRAMEHLVRENLTRHIGISNFSPADVETILTSCQICPYAHEFEAHPYLQQQAWVDWHVNRGIKVIAYSPLANTNPTYDSKIQPILKDPFWKNIAATKNATVPQVVLAWGLQRGTVVIPKSVHEVHIKENLGALKITFSDKELGQISKQDKRSRMNNPARDWGVELFQGLDDSTGFGGESEL